MHIQTPTSATIHRRTSYTRRFLADSTEIEKTVPIEWGLRKYRWRLLHDYRSITHVLGLLSPEQAKVIWRSDTRYLRIATTATYVCHPFYCHERYICRHKIYVLQYIDGGRVGHFLLGKRMAHTREETCRLSAKARQARKKRASIVSQKISHTDVGRQKHARSKKQE